MASELAQTEIDIESANKDIIANLRLKANPDTYVQDWANQFTKVADKRLEGIKGVRTRATAEQLISRIATRETRKQKDYANKLWIDTEQAKDIPILDHYASQGEVEKGKAYLENRTEIYNPLELEKLKARFEKTAQDKMIKTLISEADMEIYRNPGKAEEILLQTKYTVIPQADKLSLLKKADIITTRKEKEIDRNNDELQKENAYNLWQEYEALKDDPVKLIAFDYKLDDYARNRLIKQSEYLALKKAMKAEEEKETNNPYVLAELTEQVEMGMDIKQAVTDAYDDGNLKGDTFVAMRKAITSTNYKQGLSYISNSMKPNQFEKWNPDIAQRYADAILDYQTRVANGADPIKTGKEIVNLNIGDRMRTLAGLRRPRYLTGEKNNTANIEAAEKATVDAYTSGKITPEEFMREAELLQSLSAVVTRLLEEPEGDAEKLEKRLKK